MSLTCGIAIPTHNRRQDLERTCSVIASLDPQPDEVVICIDGCRDDTEKFLRENHPGFRLIINGRGTGASAARDGMFGSLESDIILSLDDDSYPIEPDFIARLRAVFENNPRLAVAAFPQRSDEFPESLQATDFGPSHFIGSYANCSAAIRKSVFLELEGYYQQFWNAYDEPDFALRCVAAGYEVRMETDLSVRHHYTGVQRNELRTHRLHARNELWSVFMRCPMPQLFAVAFFRAVRQFSYALKRGWRWAYSEPVWWIACLAGLSRCLVERNPIPWERYQNWMLLVRRPIFERKVWEKRFRR
jgi:GT2 family glycosyltransferase